MTEGKESNTEELRIHVAVGSKNPCKIEAVRTAFQDAFSCSSTNRKIVIVISAHSVSSGVSDQPYSEDETKLGAKNRASKAYDEACTECGFKPDFAVGLEGGVIEEEEKDGNNESRKSLWCMAWMAILGTDSCNCKLLSRDEEESTNSEISSVANETKKIWGFGRTGSFLLPSKIVNLMHEKGMELGDADDFVFKRYNAKQGDGTVGRLTNGMIDRSTYYDHALKLALVPWIHPSLYGMED